MKSGNSLLRSKLPAYSCRLINLRYIAINGGGLYKLPAMRVIDLDEKVVDASTSEAFAPKSSRVIGVHDTISVFVE